MCWFADEFSTKFTNRWKIGGSITRLPHMPAWSAEGQLHKSTYTEIHSNKNPEC